jgi:poly(beta-D-mannuronate) lyase
MPFEADTQRGLWHETFGKIMTELRASCSLAEIEARTNDRRNDLMTKFIRGMLLSVCLLSVCTGVAFQPAGQAAAVQFICVIDPPIAEMKGTTTYADKKASVVDPVKGAQHAEMIKPVATFATHLANATDSLPLDSEKAACARKMLSTWAADNALVQTPDSFPAVRERARFTIGFNLAAVKLRQAGYPVDRDVIDWLRTLTREVVSGFALKPALSNLDIWSGVDAASFLLLSDDLLLREHARRVWRKGIDQIKADGSLDTEMGRGRRALLYHQYYMSGLLMLREMSAAIGDLPSADDHAKLKKLGRLVASSLCDSTMISKRAGAPQEKPPAYQFAVAMAFGKNILDDSWAKCAQLPAKIVDNGIGGNMDVAAAAIRSSRAQPSR